MTTNARRANLTLAIGRYCIADLPNEDRDGAVAQALTGGPCSRYLALYQSLDDGEEAPETGAALCDTVPEALRALARTANVHDRFPVGVVDLDTAQMQDVQYAVEAAARPPYPLD